MKARSSLLPLSLSLIVGAPTFGCKPTPVEGPPTVELPTDHQQSKCTVRASLTKPLIVEWPASDKAALESRIRRGAVAVRYHGCEMDVLPRCEVPSSYRFDAVTPKSDVIRMRNADDLYANIPMHAVEFEAKLERVGELQVRMAIAGLWESDRHSFSIDDLGQDCEGATHVITQVMTGAFEFYADKEVSGGAKVHAGANEVGGEMSREREILSRDGEMERCAKADAARGALVEPAPGCGALLRIEVVEIKGAIAVPVQPAGSNAGATLEALRQEASSVAVPSLQGSEQLFDEYTMQARKALDRAKGVEGDEDQPPEAIASAWCAVARLREPANPWRLDAVKKCRLWQVYAQELRAQERRMANDYALLRDFLALEHETKADKLAMLDRFSERYAALADKQDYPHLEEVARARRRIKRGGAASMPSLEAYPLGPPGVVSSLTPPADHLPVPPSDEDEALYEELGE